MVMPEDEIRMCIPMADLTVSIMQISLYKWVTDKIRYRVRLAESLSYYYQECGLAPRNKAIYKASLFIEFFGLSMGSSLISRLTQDLT